MLLPPNTDEPRSVSLTHCQGHKTARQLLTIYSDSSILSRLADTERRLQMLEEQQTTRAAAQPRHDPPSIGAAPDLHTASAHQMAYSWPRIRLCLTLANVDPLQYLAQSDAEDPLLVHTAVSGDQVPHLAVFQATQALESIYQSMEHLPVELVYLFQHYDDLSQRHVLDDLNDAYPTKDAFIDPHRLSISQLMALSIALKSDCFHQVEGLDEATALGLATVYFAIALSKQWKLFAATEGRVALSLVMAFYLVYYWSRPFHALGLLQSIHSTIKRMSFKQRDNL